MEMCRWSTVAFLVSGAIFLALRFCKIPVSSFSVPGVAGCLGAALLTAYFRTRYKLPDEERLTIFLSSLVPGGGVVLSAAECGTFPERFPPLPELPKLRFEKMPLLLGALLASILFAAGALYVPLSPPRQQPAPKTLDLKDEAEKISDALNTLRRSGPEGEKRALPLQKELEETLQKADPAAPGRSYELLHELNKRLHNELAREHERSAQMFRQMAALQNALSALESKGKAKEHAQSFSKVLKEMAKKNPHLAAALQKGGFEGANLTAEELKRLADTLGKDAAKLKKNLEDMSKYTEFPNSCAADLQAAQEELENFIKENVPGCDDLIESLTNRDNNGEPGMQNSGGQGNNGSGTPGAGGVGRGRGDAVLEFSGFTPEYGAKRVDKKVKSHLPGNKKESSVLGRFAVDMEQKEEKYTVKGGTLQTKGGFAGFQESDIHPAHRRAVREYFEKGKKEK